MFGADLLQTGPVPGVEAWDDDVKPAYGPNLCVPDGGGVVLLLAILRHKALRALVLNSRSDLALDLRYEGEKPARIVVHDLP
jgi:hypothetical protein